MPKPKNLEGSIDFVVPISKMTITKIIPPINGRNGSYLMFTNSLLQKLFAAEKNKAVVPKIKPAKNVGTKECILK